MNPIKTKKRSFVNRNFLIVTADRGKDKQFGQWRCPDGTSAKLFAVVGQGVAPKTDTVTEGKAFNKKHLTRINQAQRIVTV